MWQLLADAVLPAHKLPKWAGSKIRVISEGKEVVDLNKSSE